MKPGFVRSSPLFFRLILRSFSGTVILLLVGAWFMVAPLEEAANPAVTPNPAKSAWFLLWIQEVLSWSKLLIYPLLAAALLFFLLPWLRVRPHIHRAQWFPPEQVPVSVLAVAATIGILILTIIGLFLRGPNWTFGF